MGIRIVVNIDLPSDDPAEAYAQLQALLLAGCQYGGESEEIGWETTDEWYNSEGPLSQEEIDEACEAYDPEGRAAVLDA